MTESAALLVDTEDDMTTAMNYLGQQLSMTLFKGLHELPMPLRNEEMPRAQSKLL